MRAFICVLAVAASPVAAFEAPEGCAPKLTIQSRNCLMTNVWTCEGDAPGEQWMALFDGDGPRRVRKVDEDFQWLETFRFDPIRTQKMDLPADDPGNLTELFTTNNDTYDFIVRDERGVGLRYVGYDRLTGEETVVDGEVLKNTEYAFDVLDESGQVLDQREGRQFVSERHRIFTFGLSWDRDAPDDVRDSSPVEFVYPGEPGFFPNRPIYDCGELLSSYEVAE